MKSKIKAMIHPIRMRIVQNLLRGEEMTVQDISKNLSDIPQATLYRQLNALLKEDILTVIDENRIRGTVEKVYALSSTLESTTAEEVEEASKEDHFNFFFSFLMNQLGEYEEYLSKDEINLKEDGVSFRQFSLYLSDEELMDILSTLREKLVSAMDNKPTKDRRLRNVSTIVIPKKEKKELKE